MRDAAQDPLWDRLRRSGDPRAREALVRAHLPLVTAAVRRGGPGHGTGRRAYSCGLAGLVRAVDAHDPAGPLAFAAFAAPFIDDALLQDERYMDRVPGELRAAARRVELTATRLADTLGRVPRDDEVAAATGLEVGELWAIRRGVDESLLELDPEWTHHPWEPWEAP